ncbi:MAG: extracellular solute-binding protein [Bifidobacteriaceae bacterium]|nr:extracellular solute-binding protein [Bifidobacteriaceae bacterium]
MTQEDAASISGSVLWWAYAPDTTVGEKWIAAFNEVYPNIQVTYKNFENTDYPPALTSAFQAGSGPDVFNIAPGGSIAGRELWADYAMDLSAQAEAWLGSDWKNKYATGYVDQLTWKGSVVSLPLGGVASDFVWVNKNLFDAQGIDPLSLKTYDDLKAACDKFSAAGIQCWTMGANGMDGFAAETWRTICDSVEPGYYAAALKGERQWDEAPAIEAMQILRQMQTDGIISADATSIKQYPEANNNFMAQKAAIVQMGTWYAQYAVAESQIESAEGAGVSNPEPFVMIPIPAPDFAGKGNVPPYVGEADYGLAIAADSKNKAAASVFVMWLTSTEAGQLAVDNAIDLVPSFGVDPDWENLGLVDPDYQIPIFQEMFQTAAQATESRNEKQTPATATAQVVAVQQLLSDPNMSIEDIVAQMQADSEPYTG